MNDEQTQKTRQILHIRVATKIESENFYQFFLALKGKKVLIEDISLSGLTARNVKNLVLYIEV